MRGNELPLPRHICDIFDGVRSTPKA